MGAGDHCCDGARGRWGVVAIDRHAGHAGDGVRAGRGAGRTTRVRRRDGRRAGVRTLADATLAVVLFAETRTRVSGPDRSILLHLATSEAPEAHEPAPARRRTEGSGEWFKGLLGNVRARHRRCGQLLSRVLDRPAGQKERRRARLAALLALLPVPVGGFGRGGTRRVYGTRGLRCSVRRGRGRRGLRQRGGSRDPRSSRTCRRARTHRG